MVDNETVGAMRVCRMMCRFPRLLAESKEPWLADLWSKGTITYSDDGTRDISGLEILCPHVLPLPDWYSRSNLSAR
ncbi:hypothetical protein TNCV_3549881 [Trichonephila clavipes]|nr:hypothetical protein TNCV_3549881 [Trichonephila clavipes]